MGIFYYVGAVALAEDIPDVDIEVTDKKSLNDFYKAMDNGFQQVW